MTFDQWLEAVNQQLYERYLVDLGDVGLGNPGEEEEYDPRLKRNFDEGVPAAEFVDWFAAKYDLIEFDDIDLRAETKW